MPSFGPILQLLSHKMAHGKQLPKTKWAQVKLLREVLPLGGPAHSPRMAALHWLIAAGCFVLPCIIGLLIFGPVISDPLFASRSELLGLIGVCLTTAVTLYTVFNYGPWILALAPYHPQLISKKLWNYCIEVWLLRNNKVPKDFPVRPSQRILMRELCDWLIEENIDMDTRVECTTLVKLHLRNWSNSEYFKPGGYLERLCIINPTLYQTTLAYISARMPCGGMALSYLMYHGGATYNHLLFQFNTPERLANPIERLLLRFAYTKYQTDLNLSYHDVMDLYDSPTTSTIQVETYQTSPG